MDSNFAEKWRNGPVFLRHEDLKKNATYSMDSSFWNESLFRCGDWTKQVHHSVLLIFAGRTTQRIQCYAGKETCSFCAQNNKAEQAPGL